MFYVLCSQEEISLVGHRCRITPDENVIALRIFHYHKIIHIELKYMFTDCLAIQALAMKLVSSHINEPIHLQCFRKLIIVPKIYHPKPDIRHSVFSSKEIRKIKQASNLKRKILVYFGAKIISSDKIISCRLFSSPYRRRYRQ